MLLRIESDNPLSIAKFFEKYDATIRLTRTLGNALGNTVLVHFNTNKGQHSGLFLHDIQKLTLESTSGTSCGLR